jgi:hypothetical protein
MDRHLSEGEVAITYTPKFREYGILVPHVGDLQMISFCPWCAKRLPEILGHEWFERIWALGLEPDSANILEEYLSEAWWRTRREAESSE